MAKKITELTALTGVANTDVLPIVDVSATSTKKVTYQELFKKHTPVSLYSSTTGTTGNVTLSSSSANFTYLEIFYYAGDMYGSMKISTTKNKGTITLSHDYTSAQVFQIKTQDLSVSGTTISRGAESFCNLVYDGGNIINRGTETSIYIYRVLGWY